MEAGELPASGDNGTDEPAAGGRDQPEQGQRKRKHAPIVWSLDEEGEVPEEEPGGHRGPASKRPASVSATGGSIFDRVAQEAAEFKQRQEELGYDPDAPAAMKASPSVSGSRSGGDGEEGMRAESSPASRERAQDVAYSNGNGRQAGPSSSREGSAEEDEDMAAARPAGEHLQHARRRVSKGWTSVKVAACKASAPARNLTQLCCFITHRACFPLASSSRQR
jgi:hypothetical protein